MKDALGWFMMTKTQLLISYLTKMALSVAQKKLQKLVVEMLKVSRGLSPEVISEIYQFREEIAYEIRQRSQFHICFVHSVFSGTETFKLVGPRRYGH